MLRRTVRLAYFVALGAYAIPPLPAKTAALETKASKIDPYKEALAKRLTFIFKDQELAKTQLGVKVFSLTRGESLFELHPDKALSPASAVKLLTATAALRRLGPAHTFRTEVFAEGTLKDGNLKGNLYLKGGGDPLLDTAAIEDLVARLLRTDIRRVSGAILVDDTLYERTKADAKRDEFLTDKPYAAPVGALNFNYNATTLYCRPGRREGTPARVYVEPDSGYIKVRNQTQTAKAGTRYNLQSTRLPGIRNDEIVVRGTIAADAFEEESHFMISDPALYAGHALRFYLERRGLKVDGGEIKRAPVPAAARRVAHVSSAPLREIVARMNKQSNNFIADALVLALAKEGAGQATLDKGLRVLREEATALGMNTAGFKIVSGSGLTRDNSMSAAQFIAMLQELHKDYTVFPELLSSLPVAGRDGTLEKRLQGSSAFGRLRGKTGSIEGVSTMVGTVQAKGGELLAYAVLMNERGRDLPSLRRWQNYFGQALADFSRKKILDERPTPLLDAVMKAGEEGERDQEPLSGE